MRGRKASDRERSTAESNSAIESSDQANDGTAEDGASEEEVRVLQEARASQGDVLGSAGSDEERRRGENRTAEGKGAMGTGADGKANALSARDGTEGRRVTPAGGATTLGNGRGGQ